MSKETIDVDVVIIGAGASGLQCADSMLRLWASMHSTPSSTTTQLKFQPGENGTVSLFYSPKHENNRHKEKNTISVLILEARDRIGGRVWTVSETKPTTKGTTVSFQRDLGAAWVHGTGTNGNGEENPMMKLLQQQEQEEIPKQQDHHYQCENGHSKDSDAESCSSSCHHHHQLLLSPIFDGNCWTRPYAVLHKPGRVALYYNGTHIPNDSESIPIAIRKHYQIQQQMSDYANTLYDAGEGLETAYTSMANVRSKIVSQLQTMEHDEKNSNDSKLIEALVLFYGFLRDNWLGQSETDVPLSVVEPQKFSTNDGDDGMEEEYQDEGDYEGPHCKVQRGMETILQPLVGRVGLQHLRLGEEVSNITLLSKEEEKEENRHPPETKQQGMVQITTQSGLSIQAKCCVCTIPLGCLQQKTQASSSRFFQPSLDEGTVEALHALAPGAYKKVFMTFDRIFWPVDVPMLGLMRNRPPNGSHHNPNGDYDREDGLGNHLLVFNLVAKQYAAPCLEAILCGNNGKWAIGKGDEEIQNAVIEFIQESMGIGTDLGQWLTSCHITRWEEDPLTMGSYTNFRLGTLERHVEALQEPHWDGHLLFAGEYTESEPMGSVHAALMSGERAARQAVEKVSALLYQQLQQRQL